MPTSLGGRPRPRRTLAHAPPVRDGLTELLADARSGDTVVVPEGLYKGDFTVPEGVTVQPAKAARVIIDVDDYFVCTNATVRDLELFSSETDRTIIQQGIVANNRASLTGCTIHDLRISGINWFGSGEGELVDNLIYNNGYLSGVGSGHGHCIYTHNHVGGARLIANNVLLPGYGSYGLHGYSGGGNKVRDYTVRQNFQMRKPVIMGGGAVSNLLYEDNFQWREACYIGRYSASNVDCVVQNNQYAGGAVLDISGFAEAVDEGNTTPTELRVIITPCTRTPRKMAHVTVFNPERLKEVALDLSALALAHSNYRLRNAMNIAEQHTFTYKGEAVSVPTMENRWSVAVPVGANEPLYPYDVRIGAWILERV